MKAVITAQFDLGVLNRLHQEMEVVHTGWGVTERTLSETALIAELRDAEILVTELERCSARVIENCPGLAFIGCCRNNPVNIDVEAASLRGIPAVYAPGRNAQAVAEMTVALMVMISRKMGRALLDVRHGEWKPEARFSYLSYEGHELQGKTVGIVGLGTIGERVRCLCQAFGMRVLAYDPYEEQQINKKDEIVFVALKTLLQQADFVTLHVPDTAETVGMISAEQLGLMKPTAFLINTARGHHVREGALADALRSEKIAGAALDVYRQEPLLLDHVFFDLENVILMPHIGGATYDVIRNHSRIMCGQIHRFLQGEELAYLRNPQISASG